MLYFVVKFSGSLSIVFPPIEHHGDVYQKTTIQVLPKYVWYIQQSLVLWIPDLDGDPQVRKE